jgi:hypothetical protein
LGGDDVVKGSKLVDLHAIERHDHSFVSPRATS